MPSCAPISANRQLRKDRGCGCGGVAQRARAARAPEGQVLRQVLRHVLRHILLRLYASVFHGAHVLRNVLRHAYTPPSFAAPNMPSATINGSSFFQTAVWIHTHACTHTRTHAHTRARARAHAHTHTRARARARADSGGHRKRPPSVRAYAPARSSKSHPRAPPPDPRLNRRPCLSLPGV